MTTGELSVSLCPQLPSGIPPANEKAFEMNAEISLMMNWGHCCLYNNLHINYVLCIVIVLILFIVLRPHPLTIFYQLSNMLLLGIALRHNILRETTRTPVVSACSGPHTNSRFAGTSVWRHWKLISIEFKYLKNENHKYLLSLFSNSCGFTCMTANSQFMREFLN